MNGQIVEHCPVCKSARDQLKAFASTMQTCGELAKSRGQNFFVFVGPAMRLYSSDFAMSEIRCNHCRNTGVIPTELGRSMIEVFRVYSHPIDEIHVGAPGDINLPPKDMT